MRLIRYVSPEKSNPTHMKKNSKERPNKRMKKAELQEKILAFLEKENRQAFNYKQIAFAIDARDFTMDVINMLDQLAATDVIQEVGLGKYRAPANRGSENVGTFIRRSNGRNAVLIDDEQIMVAERNSMHALNGDKVRVMISAARKGVEPEARVLEILEAKDQVFIGELVVDRNGARMVPDSSSLPPTSFSTATS